MSEIRKLTKQQLVEEIEDLRKNRAYCEEELKRSKKLLKDFFERIHLSITEKIDLVIGAYGGISIRKRKNDSGYVVEVPIMNGWRSKIGKTIEGCLDGLFIDE